MEGGERKMKLFCFCPSLSKSIQSVAGEEDQKLDLGSIARAFGLDPNTLRLNGYFISRGADLIASTVTWHSLIRFFSARGLPTGAAPSAALLVDGKLSKIGSKRSHYVEEAADVMDNSGFRHSKRPQHEHCSVQGLHNSSALCLKREWGLEDESRLKRARSDEGRFACSIISNNLKRMRIDEIFAASPSKKLR